MFRLSSKTKLFDPRHGHCAKLWALDNVIGIPALFACSSTAAPNAVDGYFYGTYGEQSLKTLVVLVQSDVCDI